MKYVYRLKNTENGYIWGSFATADAAFDRIAFELTGVSQSRTAVIREQVG